MKKIYKYFISFFVVLSTISIVILYIIVFNCLKHERYYPYSYFHSLKHYRYKPFDYNKYYAITFTGSLENQDSCYVLKNNNLIKARFYNSPQLDLLNIKDSSKVEVIIQGVMEE